MEINYLLWLPVTTRLDNFLDVFFKYSKLNYLDVKKKLPGKLPGRFKKNSKVNYLGVFKKNLR